MYLFLETETECEWGRGREKESHRIWSRLQVPSCQHRAPCGARTHEPWDHDMSRSRMLNRWSHPGALVIYFERECKGRRAERGRERIPGRLHTVSTEPHTGLKLTNCEIMTWAEIKSQILNRLSHPGPPILFSWSLNLLLYLLSVPWI